MRIAADLLLIILVTAALLVYEWKTVLVLYISFLPFMFAYVFIVRDKLKMYAREDFNAKKTQARIVSSPHLTILSIAHRESTLAYCTRIINLEENNG